MIVNRGNLQRCVLQLWVVDDSMWQSGAVVLWMGLFAYATAKSGNVSSLVTASPTTATVSPSMTSYASTMMSLSMSVGPTPTPTPTPLPHGPYIVKKNDDKDKTCIRMEAEISVQVKYPTMNGTRTVTLRLTNSTDPHVDPYDSYCHEDSSNMTIVWTTSHTHLFSLHFKRSKYTWSLHKLKLYLNATSSDFPDIYIAGNTTIVQAEMDSDIFDNEFQRSYKCRHSSFKLTTEDNSSFNKTDFVATIKLKNWQVQAFEFRKNNEFGNARVCPEQQSSNAIVPIAVGIALGVLVTAVVVVYLLSRLRRRRLTSYEALN